MTRRVVQLTALLVPLAAFVAGYCSVPREAEIETSVTPSVEEQSEKVNPAPPPGDVRSKSRQTRETDLCKQLSRLDELSSAELIDLQRQLAESDLASIAAELALTSGESEGLVIVMEIFALRDPDAAVAFALLMKSSRRGQALSAVLRTIDWDPARVLQIAQRLPPGNTRGSLMYEIFQQWMKNDFASAQLYATQVRGRDAESLKYAVVKELAEKDPRSAIDFAFNVGLGKNGSLHNVFGTWARSDPQAALRASLDLSNPQLRQNSINAIMGIWSNSDFAGALNYVLNIPESGLRQSLLSTLRPRTLQDHRVLFDTAMQRITDGDQLRRTMSLLSGWARLDREQALAAFKTIPPGPAFEGACAALASEWKMNHPASETLPVWLANIPSGQLRTNTLHTLFLNWNYDDHENALRALAELPQNDRKDAIWGLSITWSRRNYEELLEWSATLTDASEQAIAEHEGIKHWAYHAGEAASRYVDNLPEPKKGALLPLVVEAWQDANAAAEWLRKQPAGNPKDAGLEHLTNKIAVEDPRSALLWAMSITDSTRRSQRLEKLAQAWLRQDPATARTWLTTSPLPRDIRERVLK